MGYKTVEYLWKLPLYIVDIMFINSKLSW